MMTHIDVDKVKKQYDWDPSKGDYIHKPQSRRTNSNKVLYLLIAVVIVFGIIAYIKFF
jgi:hypothetical protein